MITVFICKLGAEYIVHSFIYLANFFINITSVCKGRAACFTTTQHTRHTSTLITVLICYMCSKHIVRSITYLTNNFFLNTGSIDKVRVACFNKPRNTAYKQVLNFLIFNDFYFRYCVSLSPILC